MTVTGILRGIILWRIWCQSYPYSSVPAIPAPVAAVAAAAVVLEAGTTAAELGGGCCGGIYSNDHMGEMIHPTG